MTSVAIRHDQRCSVNALLMMAGTFVTSIGVVVYNISQVGLRQSIVPRRIQGRMNASMRWIVWGTISTGAIAGGILGRTLGLREAIGIGVVGGILAFLWILFFISPITQRDSRTLGIETSFHTGSVLARLGRGGKSFRTSPDLESVKDDP